MAYAHVILSECLLPGPRTELPGPVPGQARVWLRHCSTVEGVTQSLVYNPPLTCMQKGRVVLTMQALGHHHNCISVPPPLWNVPLQSIMDGHLSCSSYGHRMHLLIIITCAMAILTTHSCKQVMGFNNVVSTVIA